MPELATKKNCTGCMACYDKCPRQAIESYKGKDGHNYVKIITNKCIECKLCEKACPVVSNYIYGTNNIISSFYAGWSNNSDIRKSGATSGIFGTIADFFLNNGGWIAGAVMNGLECQYIVTDKREDIKQLQGSKYTTSNPKGIYSKILKLLKNGKSVLFSGLPCHVAALLLYIPDKLHENLYTIDLICGGVSSSLLIKKFAENHPNIESICSFRNKRNGWHPNGYRYSLKWKNKDGFIEYQNTNKKNIVTDGFACELTDRQSCYDCKFAYIDRRSDITIGDLWKDKDFYTEHFNGVSSIIIHSTKGEYLLKQANIQTTPIDSRKVLNPNHRIYNGKSIKCYLPERKLISFLFKYLPYSTLKRIYCSDFDVRAIWWFPFALYRLLSFKLDKFLIRKNNNKILK